MALAVADRVKETSTTAGTGTLTLLGAVSGYQSFSVIGSGNTTYYCIVDDNTGEWEVGVGTYTSPNQLSRDTVLSSSSGGSAITFLGNIKQVFVTYPAERSVYENAAGSLVLSKVEATTGIITNLTSTSATITNLSLTSLTLDNLNIASANITTLTSTNATAASLTVSTGNLNFSGTAQRITGNFGLGTLDTRVVFQSNTSNTQTNIVAVENGTTTNGTGAAQLVVADSNYTTAANYVSGGVSLIKNTDLRISSFATGTASYLPMTFYNGGSERMRLDTSGRLGIGLTAPTVPLQVANASGNSVVFSNTTASERLHFYTRNAAGTSRVESQNSDLQLFAYDANALTFGTSNTTRMTIDSSGNVGIGKTAATGVILDANGVSRSTQIQMTNSAGTYTSGSAGFHLFGFSDNNLYFNWFDAGAIVFRNNGANERMRISSAGSVGIGSSTPGTYSEKLIVASAGSAQASMMLQNPGIGSGQLGIAAASPNLKLYNTYTDGLLANGKGIDIDQNGNVGIGQTSPTYKLQVNNAAASATADAVTIQNSGVVSLGDAAGIRFRYVTAEPAAIRALLTNSGNGAGRLGIFTSSDGTGANLTERLSVDSSGNVGIGGTANAQVRLDVTGTLPTDTQRSRGFRMAGTIPSGTTTNAISFYSLPDTQAASFTLTDLYHFAAVQGTFGAGSTVTNQYGYFVDSSLTGATNNYGFYSNIASGSNRWNFYAAGTAQNYFAGDTGVGATPVANTKLTVKGANQTSGQYTFIARDGSDNNTFVIENDGLIITGTQASSPYNNTTGSAANMVVSVNGLLQRSTSSLRYKTNVTDAVHGLADVLKLRSVIYKGINDGDTIFGGLIAEEVHDAGLTEFVAYDKEGRPDALHYGNMVALLVKAVQELKAELEALKAA